MEEIDMDEIDTMYEGVEYEELDEVQRELHLQQARQRYEAGLCLAQDEKL